MAMQMGIGEYIQLTFNTVLCGKPSEDTSAARRAISSLVSYYGEPAFAALVADKHPVAVALSALAIGRNRGGALQALWPVYGALRQDLQRSIAAIQHGQADEPRAARHGGEAQRPHI